MSPPCTHASIYLSLSLMYVHCLTVVLHQNIHRQITALPTMLLRKTGPPLCTIIALHDMISNEGSWMIPTREVAELLLWEMPGMTNTRKSVRTLFHFQTASLPNYFISKLLHFQTVSLPNSNASGRNQSTSVLAIVRIMSAMVRFLLWLVLLLAVVIVESVHPFSPPFLDGRGASRDSLITLYFREGYSYRCIVHGFSLYLWKLKRTHTHMRTRTHTPF